MSADPKPVSKAPKPSFIDQVLGKRKAMKALTKKVVEQEDDDDDFVVKVETKEVNDNGLIMFDEDKSKK